MLGVENQADASRAMSYYGKYPGIVVENAAADEAAHRGDLTVDVSGLLEESPDGGVRPMRVVAKPSFLPGFFFIPEKEAQVWIEFVAGDVNSPIWTGVWYPADAAPLRADEEAPTEAHKVIRTPSGHVLELDDENGKIIVLDKNENRITLDENGIIIADKYDNQIVMDSNGVLVVDGSGNEVSMQSSGVVVKSDSIKLGSDSAAEPLLLGTQWQTLFNNHMHIGNMGAPTSPPAGTGTMSVGAELSLKHNTE